MTMGALPPIAVAGECCFALREEAVVADGFWFVVETSLAVGAMAVRGEVLLNLRSRAAAGREGDTGFFLEAEAAVTAGCCCDARSSDRSGGSMEERGSKTAMLTVAEGHAATVMLSDTLCATFGNKRRSMSAR